ncbi:hypothetical protein AB4851_10485 [Burkholderia sp. 22PA0099]|uniref:hypothetical protein n=1 Tax=Burkholderia sp. 22PA0099 TaxID=3237372 RepID=UPI0039C3E4D4
MRETVADETPANLATSRRVTLVVDRGFLDSVAASVVDFSLVMHGPGDFAVGPDYNEPNLRSGGGFGGGLLLPVERCGGESRIKGTGYKIAVQLGIFSVMVALKR